MWARLGVKHPGTRAGEPSIGVRDILMFSMLINLLLLLLLLLLQAEACSNLKKLKIFEKEFQSGCFAYWIVFRIIEHGGRLLASIFTASDQLHSLDA
jgi:hypothetical protein